MSIDFKQKLAWVLRDLPDSNLDLLALAQHRGSVAADAEQATSCGGREQWLTSAADRVPFVVSGASSRAEVNWAAHPELTHPLAKARFQAEPFDLEQSQKIVKQLLSEASEKCNQDPRRILLWMWRFLPERLANTTGGPGAIATQFAADPRLPNVSVWQRIAFDCALFSACPAPSFLTLQLCGSTELLETCGTERDLFNACSIMAQLMWQAMLPIMEQLGPTAFVSPSLLRHPRVDDWLREQGVSDDAVAPAGKDGSTEQNTAPIADDLPTTIVALVPSELVAQLGEACVARFNEACEKMRDAVREHISKAGWIKAGNKTFGAVWDRQTQDVWRLCWTAVPWADDSSGAGSLLAKSEVLLQEKWARVQEDAAGLDDSVPGIFYGLWYQASVAAARTRENMAVAAVMCEPNPACTACGCRQALHDKKPDPAGLSVQAFWQQLTADKGKARGDVASDEMLCSVCAIHRMADVAGQVRLPAAFSTGSTTAAKPKKTSKKGKIEQFADDVAVIVMGLDQPGLLLRGTKEIKSAPTIGENVHSALEASFVRRARSHVKEILESPAVLGPARHIAVQQILADFATTTAASLLQQHGAVVLQLTDRQLIALAPVTQAYKLVCAVREAQQDPFVILESEGKPKVKRLALRPGPLATSSAVVALVPKSDVLGSVLSDCLLALQEVARDSLGGDSVVIMRRHAQQPSRVFAARWQQLAGSMDAVLKLVSADKMSSVIDALGSIVAAISNADLDKASVDARAELTLRVLQPLDLPSEKLPELAAAICQLIDQCVALAAYPCTLADFDVAVDLSHTLDGLHIAASLSGADQ